MAFIQEQYRPQLHEAMAEISALIFDTPDFTSAEFRFAESIGPAENTSLSIRPVTIADEFMWQLTRADRVENRPHGPAKKYVWELINSANILQEAHAYAADGSALHMRVTRKGHVLLDRVRPKRPEAKKEACCAPETSAHDHQKDYPLTRFDSSKLLIALGFSATDGTRKHSMNAKYRQVNEFLRNLDAALSELPAPKDKKAQKAPLTIVDCGCGKAYLSFAAKAYIEAVHERPVHLIGIDRKQNVIAFCRRTADSLGMGESVEFVAADIAAYKPKTTPDMVLSLHASDTATDEALAFAAEHGTRSILCAPCCQHELQKELNASARPHRAILRNGILRERLADILTDSFRAQILRVLGYRVQVVEFVDPEATARNILIRAARVSRPGTGTALADYEDLLEAWNVTPFLAKRLEKLCPELVPQNSK